MKKNKQSLTKYSKEELIDKFRALEREYQILGRAHRRALRSLAAYRNILHLELKAPEEYWDSILDSMVDEDTIDDFDLPPEKRKNQKKKEIQGYG